MRHRITISFDESKHAEITAYAEKHSLSLSELARLAIESQLKRKPPKELPDGVEMKEGNPAPEVAGAAGAAARWGIPKRKRRKASEKAKVKP